MGYKIMVKYNLDIGKWKVKYTPIPNGRVDYPYCDDKGNILVRVSGKMTEKGYFIDEKTNARHETALRLIKGTPRQAFSGRIKEVAESDFSYVELNEVEDLSQEDEYLAESDELYEHLTSIGKALKFGGWFGNGYNAKRVYIMPSKLYKGFLIMVCGHSGKGERIAEIIKHSEEIKNKAQILKSIEFENNNITKLKVNDMLV